MDRKAPEALQNLAMTTYFIGGIGTDRRAWEYPLAHIPGSVYLPFPSHDAGDTIGSYVLKFIPLIDTSQPFNIVAHSMGGIMTMELIRHIHPQKIVLLSTAKCRAEMPWRLRQMKYTRLHRLLPGKGFIAGVEYGTLLLKEWRSRPALRDLAVSMAKNNPPGFLYWCVNAIVNWGGRDNYRRDIIHIHGTKDTMFPFRNIRGALPVRDGVHNILLTRKEEITALIRQHLGF